MSRFVAVTSKQSLSDEYKGERWVNLDLVEDLLPLVNGGTRIVYKGEYSNLDVKESPEEILNQQGV